MTTGLADQAAAFRAAGLAEAMEARQAAAFFLASGIDLSKALATRGAARARLVARLERLVERERLRGNRRHWSYDLNRHIALKQALDRLRARRDAREPSAATPPMPKKRRNRKRRRTAPLEGKPSTRT